MRDTLSKLHRGQGDSLQRDYVTSWRRNQMLPSIAFHKCPTRCNHARAVKIGC